MHPNERIEIHSPVQAGSLGRHQPQRPRRQPPARTGSAACARNGAPERRSQARLPVAGAAQPARGDLQRSAKSAASGTRKRANGATAPVAQPAGFKGRGVVVAALLALALLSYGLLILSPQRVELPSPDYFMPTAAVAESAAASGSTFAWRCV